MAASNFVSRLAVVGLLAALSACAAGNTTPNVSTPAPATPEAKPPPARLTAREINEQCWMTAEAKKIADLDKRMKLVDKCVEDRTKAQQGM